MELLGYSESLLDSSGRILESTGGHCWLRGLLLFGGTFGVIKESSGIEGEFWKLQDFFYVSQVDICSTQATFWSLRLTIGALMGTFLGFWGTFVTPRSSFLTLEGTLWTTR